MLKGNDINVGDKNPEFPDYQCARDVTKSLNQTFYIFIIILMPTKEEAMQDILETEREIEELELKAKLNPRLASAYNNMITERKEFIKKLKEYYQL